MAGAESSGAGLNAQGAGAPEKYYLRIVLLITSITYLGSLRFDFVSDDFSQIVSNPFIKAWHYVPQYFSGVVWRQMFPSAPVELYRPLVLVWMRLNYAIFVTRSFGWHAMAILLHVLVTWLVYVLVKKITGRFTPAWLAALFFGVHPVHHEVVAWISGAGESLFAVLFLAAFLAYWKSLEKSKAMWMTISCVLFALGLLSNEAAVVLPVLVFAHDWIAGSSMEREERAEFAGRIRDAILSAAIYVPIAAVYFFARYRAASGYRQAGASASFSTWLLTLPSVLFFYARNWFFPAGLAENYDLYYQSRVDWAHVVMPALIVLALGGMIWVLRKWIDAREINFAAAWIVAPLLPALAFVQFQPEELVHDRYFYVPSIGASLLVALCLERALASRRMVFGQPVRVVAGALTLTLVLAGCAIWTSSFWENGFTMYTRAHEIAPRNSAAASGLSEEYLNRKDFDRAEALLASVAGNSGGDSRFSLNLGRTQYFKRQYASAEENLRRSIALGPYVGEPYVYLGMIQLKQDHPREALVNLRRAVELSPLEPHYRTSYGIGLEVNGDCASAMSQFEEALALNPGDGLTQREIFRCRSAAAAAGKGSGAAKP
jgi:tetratricopeptide (TPR) repeat protein